jgi:hypothetical protein
VVFIETKNQNVGLFDKKLNNFFLNKKMYNKTIMAYINLLDHLEYIRESYNEFRLEYTKCYGNIDQMIEIVDAYFDILIDPFNIYIGKCTLSNIIHIITRNINHSTHNINFCEGFVELIQKYQTYLSYKYPHQLDNEYMNLIEENKYYNMIYVEELIA